MLNFKSPAKINLGLYITGKRANGYHELASLFIPIALYDNILVEEDRSDKLLIDGPFAEGVPEDETNIVMKAIRLLRQECEFPFLKIKLTKHIPNQAGLGGGSSNAGTIIRELVKYFKLGIEQKRLERIALSLGADVSFFLNPKPSLVKGIGEFIYPFKLQKKFSLLLVKSDIKISTREAYSKLTLSKYNVNGPVLLDSLVSSGLRDLRSLSLIKNELEGASMKLSPSLMELRQFIESYSPLLTMMTGSGSAFYGLFEGDRAFKLKLPNKGKKWLFFTTSLLG